ncbi:uncharacterized protein LOC128963558 [Oppia nitens]|uniref:uncharacterized protein LOC128963558 n=1 Tax=Oppia nitens TaxID=1686743 RepID=UPI0023DBE1F5|nr:uncharacterized protein LOC128963558 [Oppia nitens]
MRTKLFFLLLLSVAFLTSGQRRRPGRNRKSGKQPNCHLKDIEKCLEPLSSLSKSDDPTAILTSSAGLDRLCGAIKNRFGNCVRDFFKKCGTPLHREVSSLVVDQMLSHTKPICQKGSSREKFIKSSNCLNRNVFSTKTAKQDCNQRYISTLNTAAALNDSSVLAICCGFRFWQKCTEDLAASQCGAEGGVEGVRSIVSHVFLDLPNLSCPADLFDSDSTECQSVIAAKGSKKQKLNSDSGVARYNVAHIFSFMFSV